MNTRTSINTRQEKQKEKPNKAAHNKTDENQKEKEKS